MSALNDYVDSYRVHERIEGKLGEIEAEYAKSIEKKRAAFLVYARTFSCSACAAITGGNCKFDGAFTPDRVHDVRAKRALERLEVMGFTEKDTVAKP